MALNILKLCVGCESVDDLVDWQRTHPSPFPTGERQHVTRMWPKRGDEVLDGGALYWVIKGVILCRQTILRLDRVQGADGIPRCGLVLNPAVRDRVEELLAQATGLPLVIEEESSLGEGQVFLRLGPAETKVDLTQVTADISAAVRAFFSLNSEEPSHG